MPRKQRSKHSPHNVIHVRLDDELHNQLKREADRRHVPVSREIRNRLLDSFEQDIKRGFLDLLLDLQTIWRRFPARFVSRELADKLADAVMANKNASPESKILAKQIIDLRAVEQREPAGEIL